MAATEATASDLAPIDYRARLARVQAALGGGALVVLSQPTAKRNSSVDHHYRQESFFYWLTGFEEPEAAVIVAPFRPVGEQVQLFLRERDPERELWDGRRLGIQRAPQKLAIDAAHPIETLWEKLPDNIGEADKVYFALGLSEEYDRRFVGALNAHKAKFGKLRLAARLPVYDSMHLAGTLRLRKDADEMAIIRFSSVLTLYAYAKVFQAVRPGMNERQVHALLMSEFLAGGGEMEAYGSIVAGGVNACILHYHENDQPLREGELLLIDAGAQAHYYATDVTRTFPIGKTFSPEQKALYEIVLKAQKASIAKAIPGSSLAAVHEESISQLVDGLRDLKLLKQPKDEIIEKGLFKRYYPHGTSHWIGMDVHDVGVYRVDPQTHQPLEAGMYFSVEPGIYVDPADESAPAAFRGIGIRIEDDVLVTATGNEVITAGIAKEVRELENR